MKGNFKNTMKKALCYLLTAGMTVGMSVPGISVWAAEDVKLIAKYDFENASGTTVPNEAEGADGFAGTLSGSNVSIAEGTALGKSLKFTDGQEGHMLVDKILNTGTTSYSISMWYKYDTAANRNNKNAVLLQQGGGGRTLLTLTPANKYHTYINTADKYSTGSVDVEKWQHVIIANDAANQKVKFYMNGALDSEQDAGSGKVNELTSLFIGRHKNGGTDPQSMRGLVDEICIYEGMVSDAQALAIYEEKAAVVNASQPTPTPEPTEAPDGTPIVYTVDPKTVERALDDSVFGINHRYAFNGYGTFDSYLMEMKEDFQELYEEAGFGSIRYPGGTISNLFNWKTTLDSVGRKDQIHGFYNNAGQGGIAPNFGIKEIADFADEADSEIVYVYSLGRGSVQDAEDLIEFLNAEVGTNPNGGIDWAEVRAENGHPAPYNVRYFEIGNEMQQVYADGTSSQGYWLHGVANSEDGYIEGGTATFTKQYAVCEEDWNQAASRSDGSANMVRYMRYANTNPKKYDENGNIVDDEKFTAVNKGSVAVFVGSEEWTIVDSFDNSAAADKHVVVDYSTGAIHFGDGEKGAIPASGQQIFVSYSVERDGFVDISKAMKETTAAINAANAENGVDAQHEAFVYSSYETQGFITKMQNRGYNELYDGLTIHPYSGTPEGTGATFYDSAMSLAESSGVRKVQNYVNMMPADKVPVISEYGIFRSTDPLVRSQTHAVYIAKVLMEYVRLNSPYIQKHCLTDWYSSGADSLGPTQQAVIQVVAQNGANTKTGEGDFAFFATPSAKVFQMFNSSFGDEVLAGSFNVNEKLSNGAAAYSALASRDGYDNYYAAIVNVDRENAKTFEVKVEGVDFTGKDVTVQMLSSDSYADENTLENPDKVAVETTSFVNEGAAVSVEIPKHSFAVVKVAYGVDKTALEEVIKEAKDVDKADYTEESWTAAKLEAVLADAEAVLAKADADKEAVEGAAAALETAMETLEIKKADKAALRVAIDRVARLESTDYTGESWNAMQKIYSAAHSVVVKENASQELVDKVTKDLRAATDALKKVIPVSAMTATAGDFQNGEGPELAIDGNTGTVWHTNWYTGPNHDNHWLQIELDKMYMVDGFQYLPRQSGSNGIITAYEIHVSQDGEEWQKVAEGSWAADASWKTAEFDAVNTKYVKLVTIAAQSDQSVKFASAAEIRLTGDVAGETPTPEVTESPQPTETESPQPTETESPQPTETESPQPTETESPQPTETPEVKDDVTSVFDDVYDDWYTEYVQYVYDNSLMTGIKGTKHFAPFENITKAQVAQVLYNMEGQPAIDLGSAKAFKELVDVYDAEWYAPAVAWAYEAGVVTGDLNAKKFSPDADVTREQLALMMYRYAKHKGYDVSAGSDFAGLANADKIADWSMDGMKWAVGEGLISGAEVNGVKDLDPQGTAQRAQVAAILQRFCDAYTD